MRRKMARELPDCMKYMSREENNKAWKECLKTLIFGYNFRKNSIASKMVFPKGYEDRVRYFNDGVKYAIGIIVKHSNIKKPKEKYFHPYFKKPKN